MLGSNIKIFLRGSSITCNYNLVLDDVPITILELNKIEDNKNYTVDIYTSLLKLYDKLDEELISELNIHEDTVYPNLNIEIRSK